MYVSMLVQLLCFAYFAIRRSAETAWYDFFTLFCTIESYISNISLAPETAMYDFFALLCTIESYTPHTSFAPETAMYDFFVLFCSIKSYTHKFHSLGRSSQ